MLASNIHLQHPSNLICATILTGVYDVNRNELLAEDDFERIKDWYESIVKLQLRGVVFHNTFSQKTVEAYQNQYVTFLNVEYGKRLNANVFRYLIYREFIRQYSHKIANIFVTDISDVVVVQNPFVQPLFLENPDALFCGDEVETLDNEWMQNHSTHLRNSIVGFAAYEQKNQKETLLNCGIIGGNVQVMKTLMDSLADIHRTHTIHNQTPYTLDMGAFNFVARTQFAQRLLHGAPINTRFKRYESDRSDCWFRHK